MIRLVRLLLPLVFATSLSGCVFYGHPHHWHHPPPPRGPVYGPPPPRPY